MHLGGRCYCRVELLTSKGAEKSTVAAVGELADWLQLAHATCKRRRSTATPDIC